MSRDNFIFGIHAVLSALQKSDNQFDCLYIPSDKKNNRLKEVIRLAKEKKCHIEYLAKKEFSERFSHVSHQGVVLALAKATKQYHENDLKDLLQKNNNAKLILILDMVTDPHNLGACLRSADAFAVDMVIAPKDKSCGLTPVVKKVACGAAETVPFIQVTNLARTIKQLQEQGVWIYGACGEAEQSLYQLDLKGDVALVMGAEGSGLRRLTRETCDGVFKIPMYGHVSSLNVSVATGICLSEARRQHC